MEGMLEGGRQEGESGRVRARIWMKRFDGDGNDGGIEMLGCG